VAVRLRAVAETDGGDGFRARVAHHLASRSPVAVAACGEETRDETEDAEDEAREESVRARGVLTSGT